jgi:hypothetical protein
LGPEPYAFFISLFPAFLKSKFFILIQIHGHFEELWWQPKNLSPKHLTQINSYRVTPAKPEEPCLEDFLVIHPSF